MEKENTLSNTTWNLYKFTPKVVLHAQERVGMLSTADTCKWRESDVLAYSKESFQMAIVAARDIHLGLSAIIAALLAPSFLGGLIRLKTIKDYFDVYTVSILKELAALKKHTCIEHHTMLRYLNRPQDHMPHVVAALLQVADIIRVYCNGVTFDGSKLLLLSLDNGALLFALKYFYIPLAHRTQLYPIQTKLADFWLKRADEVSYNAISTKLGISKWQRQQNLDLIAEGVYTAIKRLCIDFEIKKRVKSIYSIWYKIQQKNIDFEEVHDLSAIRIIIRGMRGKSSITEKIVCWKVLMVLNELYKPIGKVMRDWISVPKDNGYESLHLTFETHPYNQLEVQIRTQRMDDTAEHGGAAHWRYKCNNG